MTERNNTYRVLLVEGNLHDRRDVHRMVKTGIRCCTIIDCSLAREASSLIKDETSSYDLVVTDLHLPDNSGLAMYREVKGVAGCPPFVALSDTSSSETAMKALEEGVYACLDKDSEIYPAALPMMIRNVLLRNRGGGIRYKAGHVLRDALNQQESDDQRRMERENRLLVTAFEHTAESVFILDSRGLIQYLNPAANRALEAQREDLLGELYEQYISLSEGETFSLSQIDGTPRRVQGKRKDVHGVIRELEVIISPVKDKAGNIATYTVIEHDVTEEKARQISLERMRRIEALGILAGGMAHDFINILQPIIINTELISDSLPADAPERAYLDQIMEASRIGRDITNQIKIFGSRKETSLKHVAIETVTLDAMRIVSRSLPPHITLRQKITPTKALIRIEPTQFNHLLSSLGSNAVQAMEDKTEGTLAVTLVETHVEEATPAFVSHLVPGEYLKLTVRDNGCGMSPEIIEQIFDPLFTTKKSSKGKGLGLGVVHAVVKNAGGSIIVHSKPGKGSSFEIYFPKLVRTSDEQTEETLLVGSVRRARILLVDDNALELRSIHRILIRLGYRVASTNDSFKALDLFRKTPDAFDLLITDQLMPGMNGDEMASSMLTVRKDLPVILCSGSDEALEMSRLRQDLFPLYLSKPFTSRILAEAIDQALGRSALHFKKTVV